MGYTRMENIVRITKHCTWPSSLLTYYVAMDVSADLSELGRTPVAVVCAGVKSILDIGRTLEVLVCKTELSNDDCYGPV